MFTFFSFFIYVNVTGEIVFFYYIISVEIIRLTAKC